MKIKDYLCLKYHVRTPTTMTYQEAKVFGIPWPLSKGWLKTYGGFNVSEDTADKLIVANELRRRKTKSDNAKHYAEKGIDAGNHAKRVAVWTPKIAPESDKFLESYEWRRIRMAALEKYGSRCQCCGATPADGARMNVDHIKPRLLFPEQALDINNLQVLCHECNHGKGNWDMTDWRKDKSSTDHG